MLLILIIYSTSFSYRSEYLVNDKLEAFFELEKLPFKYDILYRHVENSKGCQNGGDSKWRHMWGLVVSGDAWRATWRVSSFLAYQLRLVREGYGIARNPLYVHYWSKQVYRHNFPSKEDRIFNLKEFVKFTVLKNDIFLVSCQYSQVLCGKTETSFLRFVG